MPREIPPIGTMRAVPGVHGRLYVVGEAPGVEEERTGLPFVGPSGRLLMSCLSKAGVLRSNIRIANTCWVRPPGNDLGKVPQGVRSAYEDRLRQDVLTQQPSLILAVGNHALKALTGLEGISTYRGTLVPCSFAPVMVLPTYHPAAVLRNWDWYETLLLDVQKAARLSLGGYAPKEEHLFPRCSPAHFAALLDAIPEGQAVALDIETNPSTHAITIIGVAWSEHEAANIVLPEHQPEALLDVLLALEHLAGRCPIVAHNATYEQVWLYMMLHTWVPVAWDTMLMHHTLRPAAEKSLAYCASIYLAVPAWKHTARDDAITYNLHDCLHTLQLFHVLRTELERTKLLPFYLDEVHPRIELSAFMQCRGLRVDVAEQQRLLSALQAQLEALEAKVSGYGINPASPKQLCELLYEHLSLPVQLHKHSRKPSVDKAAIKRLLRKAKGEAKEFLIAYSEWRKLRDAISKDLGVEPDPLTGCIHSGYNAAGTESGRFSASANAWDSGTNLQNRQKRFRSMFIPHNPAHVFIACDSIQAEAYVVAWLSDDEDLIAAFQAGKDLHIYTAAQMFGIPESEVTKEQRSIGKRIRHACNYSMSKVTLAEVMDITQAEAEELIERYHRTNPALRATYFPCIDALITTRGYLETPLGRRRHFFPRAGDSAIKREAYSFIPQSTVGDLAIGALHRFFHSTKDDHEVAVAAQIHDENIVEVPLHKARQAALLMKQLMERPMQVRSLRGTVRTLVIPCDFKIGKNLGPEALREWDPTTQEPEEVLDCAL